MEDNKYYGSDYIKVDKAYICDALFIEALLS